MHVSIICETQDSGTACTHVYSGTSDSGLSQIRTQHNKPLYKGHDLRSHNNSSIYIAFLTSQRGQLPYQNKQSCPKVSFIRRSHCSSCNVQYTILLLSYVKLIIIICVLCHVPMCLNTDIQINTRKERKQLTLYSYCISIMQSIKHYLRAHMYRH